MGEGRVGSVCGPCGLGVYMRHRVCVEGDWQQATEERKLLSRAVTCPCTAVDLPAHTGNAERAQRALATVAHNPRLLGPTGMLTCDVGCLAWAALPSNLTPAASTPTRPLGRLPALPAAITCMLTRTACLWPQHR